MKVTHNKVGQNLNLIDNAKADRAEAGKSKESQKKADLLFSSGLGDSSRVEVSPRAQEARRIKELAMAVPDVDEAKVAKFRKLIDDGEYSVDSKAVADRLVDEHLGSE
ncbi:MAG: flagellar biosynthesis anti-sigma factor FlgM [Pseudobdellovibrionaceae bacterium]